MSSISKPIPDARSLLSGPEAISKELESNVAKRSQRKAVFFAIVWIALSIFVFKLWAQNYTQKEINAISEKTVNQANFIAQSVYKDMFIAEQFAFALSFEAGIVRFAETASSLKTDQLTSDVRTRAGLYSNLDDSTKVNSLFQNLLANLNLMSLFLLDAKGNCIASSFISLANDGGPLHCVGSNYASRQYFKDAREQGKGRQFAVGKRVPLPSIFFANAVYSGSQFVGAIVVRLDTDQILASMDLLDSTTWLTDYQGIIISSNRPDLLMRHVGANFTAIPEKNILKNVYRVETLSELPLAWDGEQNLLTLNSRPMIFGKKRLEKNDFEVWHGYDVSGVLGHPLQYWSLCSAVTLLGLLIILIFERSKSHQRLQAEHLKALARMNDSLKDTSQELFKVATTDDLTQISSRGYFFHRLSEAIDVARRENQPLTYMQVDIDHFKKVNDTFGHPAGDAVIAQVAKTCKQCIRSADLLGRIGGEEFAIGLINCDRDQAQDIAEKIRSACQNESVIYEDKRIQISCSFGISVMRASHDLKTLISVADSALYEAKNAGRNQCRFHNA